MACQLGSEEQNVEVVTLVQGADLPQDVSPCSKNYKKHENSGETTVAGAEGKCSTQNWGSAIYLKFDTMESHARTHLSRYSRPGRIQPTSPTSAAPTALPTLPPGEFIGTNVDHTRTTSRLRTSNHSCKRVDYNPQHIILPDSKRPGSPTAPKK